MKIFVTGATGFIGAAVAEAFARAGHTVRGLTRSGSKVRELERREILPLVGSMQEPSSWISMARESDVMVHAAAEYSPEMFDLDMATVEAMVDAGRQTGRSRLIVYTSGVWVYGNTGPEPRTEAGPVEPPPLVTKRITVEKRVLAANAEGVRTVVIRPGCVYGGWGSLTAQWFETAVKGGAAQIVGSGENRWAMVHRDDLADLYLRVAESGLGGEVLNATDRSRFTVLECARAASAMVGSDGNVECVPLADAVRKMGPMAQCLAMDQHVDSRKASALLGWNPGHGGFLDGVVRYHAAWKSLRVAS